MRDVVVRQLFEILNRARAMHGTLQSESQECVLAHRAIALISRYNDLNETNSIGMFSIVELHSWRGPDGRSMFAHKNDVAGALSEIIGAIESLPELKASKKDQSSDVLRLIHLANSKLRKALHNKPESEKEIQNAFETLLIGADIAYSREADSIEYSSKTYIPDFTFSALDLAIEIKYCASPGRERTIIAEINDDILAYRTKYENVIFIVYDLGLIRDVDRFAESFEASTNVFVAVIKH